MSLGHIATFCKTSWHFGIQWKCTLCFVHCMVSHWRDKTNTARYLRLQLYLYHLLSIDRSIGESIYLTNKYLLYECTHAWCDNGRRERKKWHDYIIFATLMNKRWNMYCVLGLNVVTRRAYTQYAVVGLVAGWRTFKRQNVRAREVITRLLVVCVLSSFPFS